MNSKNSCEPSRRDKVASEVSFESSRGMLFENYKIILLSSSSELIFKFFRWPHGKNVFGNLTRALISQCPSSTASTYDHTYRAEISIG